MAPARPTRRRKPILAPNPTHFFFDQYYDTRIDVVLRAACFTGHQFIAVWPERGVFNRERDFHSARLDVADLVIEWDEGIVDVHSDAGILRAAG